MKTPHPWLTNDLKQGCHALLDDILDHSATPSDFENICERIRDVNDARKERGVLIDSIYCLIGETNSTEKKRTSALEKVYKAFWLLENAS